MQTTHDVNPVSAVTQEPLLHQEQLVPGLLLTSLAGNFIWRVVERAAVNTILAKYPLLQTTTCEHHWAPDGRGQLCACGMRQTTIKELLPLQAGKARFHMLVPKPTAIVSTPTQHAVYAYLAEAGVIRYVTLLPMGVQWSRPMPIVPILHKIWALPMELEGFMLGTGIQTEGAEL